MNNINTRLDASNPYFRRFRDWAKDEGLSVEVAGGAPRLKFISIETGTAWMAFCLGQKLMSEQPARIVVDGAQVAQLNRLMETRDEEVELFVRGGSDSRVYARFHRASVPHSFLLRPVPTEGNMQGERPADMGHHGFPHAGKLQGITDFVIDEIRRMRAGEHSENPPEAITGGVDMKLRQAMSEAAAEGRRAATTQDGRTVFFSMEGDDVMAGPDADLSCPYCGGSGHKDDISDATLSAAQAEFVATTRREVLEEVASLVSPGPSSSRATAQKPTDTSPSHQGTDAA